MQRAFLFGGIPIIEKLFELSLNSPKHPIRAGIDTPVPMFSHFDGRIATGTAATPLSNAYMALATKMADQLAVKLAALDPAELDPTTGLIFEPGLASKLKEGYPILMKSFQQQFAHLQQAAIESVSARPPLGSQTDDRGNRL